MTGFLKNYTDAELEKQYADLLEIVEREFPSARATALIDLYNANKEQITYAPASAKFNYHNAFPGGYLEHVLRVYHIAMKMSSLYLTETVGGEKNFTREEVAFCALNHDLGKIGDGTNPYYVLETDSFWIKKGSNYKYNDAATESTVYERTIFLLQEAGVRMSLREMIGIKLTDGMYDEGNKKYFLSNKKFPFDTALPYLLHWSDHMATIAEKDAARRSTL